MSELYLVQKRKSVYIGTLTCECNYVIKNKVVIIIITRIVTLVVYHYYGDYIIWWNSSAAKSENVRFRGGERN